MRSSSPRTKPRSRSAASGLVPAVERGLGAVADAVEPPVQAAAPGVGMAQLCGPRARLGSQAAADTTAPSPGGGESRPTASIPSPIPRSATGSCGLDQQPALGRLHADAHHPVAALGHGDDEAADADLRARGQLQGTGVDRREPGVADGQAERRGGDRQAPDPGPGGRRRGRAARPGDRERRHARPPRRRPARRRRRRSTATRRGRRPARRAVRSARRPQAVPAPMHQPLRHYG